MKDRQAKGTQSPEESFTLYTVISPFCRGSPSPRRKKKSRDGGSGFLYVHTHLQEAAVISVCLAVRSQGWLSACRSGRRQVSQKQAKAVCVMMGVQ